MATHFEILDFREQLGPAGSPPVDWAPFVGDQSSIETFQIEGSPVFVGPDGVSSNQAYFVIQTWGVLDTGNQILINGQPLGGMTIPPNEGWQSWTGVFTLNLLVTGENTVQIVRNPLGSYPFIVGSVIVGWKEHPPVPGAPPQGSPPEGPGGFLRQSGT